MPDDIVVLIALRGDGSVRAVLADTENVKVVIDRTDTEDPPEMREADWSPTIVADRQQEAEEAD